MRGKFLTGLATAVFLVGIVSISHATTFSDDFDDPDFTNSHWLDGNPLAPQTWSSVILNGSDLGYHSTVDSLGTLEPAVKVADNGKEYNNAGLYIETLVRIDSHADINSTQDEKVFVGSGTEKGSYLATVQLEVDGELLTGKLYIELHFDDQPRQILDVVLIPINFDTFYKLVVQIDSDQNQFERPICKKCQNLLVSKQHREFDVVGHQNEVLYIIYLSTTLRQLPIEQLPNKNLFLYPNPQILFHPELN